MVSFLGIWSLISLRVLPWVIPPECPASHLRQLGLGWSVRGCTLRMLRADSSPLVQLIAGSPVHLSASSLVAIANLNLVRIAAISDFHPPPSDPDLPPREKDEFPILVRLCRIMPSLSEFHHVHRNRKFSTVSAIGHNCISLFL